MNGAREERTGRAESSAAGTGSTGVRRTEAVLGAVSLLGESALWSLLPESDWWSLLGAFDVLSRLPESDLGSRRFCPPEGRGAAATCLSDVAVSAVPSSFAPGARGASAMMVRSARAATTSGRTIVAWLGSATAARNAGVALSCAGMGAVGKLFGFETLWAFSTARIGSSDCGRWAGSFAIICSTRSDSSVGIDGSRSARRGTGADRCFITRSTDELAVYGSWPARSSNASTPNA